MVIGYSSTTMDCLSIWYISRAHPSHWQYKVIHWFIKTNTSETVEWNAMWINHFLDTSCDTTLVLMWIDHVEHTIQGYGNLMRQCLHHTLFGPWSILTPWWPSQGSYHTCGKLGKLWATSKIPAMTLRTTTFYDITKVYAICIIPNPLLWQMLGPLILFSIATSLVTGQK